ncbi:hypothetical protein BaRGS_00036759, partial [Batillaria attramentaria]
MGSVTRQTPVAEASTQSWTRSLQQKYPRISYHREDMNEIPPPEPPQILYYRGRHEPPYEWSSGCQWQDQVPIEYWALLPSRQLYVLIIFRQWFVLQLSSSTPHTAATPRLGCFDTSQRSLFASCTQTMMSQRNIDCRLRTRVPCYKRQKLSNLPRESICAGAFFAYARMTNFCVSGGHMGVDGVAFAGTTLNSSSHEPEVATAFSKMEYQIMDIRRKQAKFIQHPFSARQNYLDVDRTHKLKRSASIKGFILPIPIRIALNSPPEVITRDLATRDLDETSQVTAQLEVQRFWSSDQSCDQGKQYGWPALGRSSVSLTKLVRNSGLRLGVFFSQAPFTQGSELSIRDNYVMQQDSKTAAPGPADTAGLENGQRQRRRFNSVRCRNLSTAAYTDVSDAAISRPDVSGAVIGCALEPRTIRQCLVGYLVQVP